MSSKPKHDLGVKDGLLARCPDSPNCVSSQASDDEHAIEPIEVSGKSQEEVMSAVRKALSDMPRIKIVTDSDGYIHATATTLIMRYVDDVECFHDASAEVVHFRSASRLGYSDLGANRARMEALRGLVVQHLTE